MVAPFSPYISERVPTIESKLLLSVSEPEVWLPFRGTPTMMIPMATFQRDSSSQGELMSDDMELRRRVQRSRMWDDFLRNVSPELLSPVRSTTKSMPKWKQKHHDPELEKALEEIGEREKAEFETSEKELADKKKIFLEHLMKGQTKEDLLKEELREDFSTEIVKINMEDFLRGISEVINLPLHSYVDRLPRAAVAARLASSSQVTGADASSVSHPPQAHRSVEDAYETLDARIEVLSRRVIDLEKSKTLESPETRESTELMRAARCNVMRACSLALGDSISVTCFLQCNSGRR
ncbi:hypothetical protein KSP40_PGU001178 [Platanthera guangdongensis]|uniref:Uncharacterized protein n=1 Tax=Platanthera guangdongensis TaxID=2320717 RepID=A0ABR2LMS4_9ASPA